MIYFALLFHTYFICSGSNKNDKTKSKITAIHTKFYFNFVFYFL